MGEVTFHIQRSALTERTNGSSHHGIRFSKKAVRFSDAKLEPSFPRNVKEKVKQSLPTTLYPVRHGGMMTQSFSNRGKQTTTCEEVPPFDTLVLTKAVSYLESRLAHIKDAHQEELAQIDEEKKREMAKIYRTAKAQKDQMKLHQEVDDETSSHDLEVVQETIQTLQDHNHMIRVENKELAEDIEDLKNENERIRDSTERLHKAIAKIKEEIALDEARNKQLEENVAFLKLRKTQYKDARFEADMDIEVERDEAYQLRRKLEKVVAEIECRCPERGLSKAIRDAVDKDFEMVETSTEQTMACA